jgi:hypothetical protein
MPSGQVTKVSNPLNVQNGGSEINGISDRDFSSQIS